MKKIIRYLVTLCLLGVILAGCENVTGPESDTKMRNMKLTHLEKTGPKIKSPNVRVYNLALKPIQKIYIPIDPPYKNTDPNEGMVIIKYDPELPISYILNAHNLISGEIYKLQLIGKEENIGLNEVKAGPGGNINITGVIKDMPIYSYYHFAILILDKNGKKILLTDEIVL